MIQRIAAVAGVIALLITIFATLSPIELRPTTDLGVGGEHILAFAAIALCFGVAFPKRIGTVVLVMLALAICLEFGQVLVPGRHARVIDVVTRLFGSGVGLAIAWAISRRTSAA
jgi:VanZ family protein